MISLGGSLILCSLFLMFGGLEDIWRWWGRGIGEGGEKGSRLLGFYIGLY